MNRVHRFSSRYNANSAAVPAAWNGADCQRLLRRALSQIDSGCPSGLFVWLENNHPVFYDRYIFSGTEKINAAWGKPEFAAVLQDFLYSVSVAALVYELKAGAA